jgi:hypothetical protein
MDDAPSMSGSLKGFVAVVTQKIPGIVTTEEMGRRIPVGSRIFFSPRLSDRLLGPPKLLCNGYRSLFPEGKAAEA